MTKVDEVLAYASAELGKPYVFGNEGPNTFDCSGLVQWVYGHVGIKLPRTAAQQQLATSQVATPLPGDLVFYGRPAHHVAIYLGGGRQIAAPHSGAVVQIQGVSSGATYGRVGGLGTLITDVFAPVADLSKTGLTGLTDWLGPARNIVLEGAVVATGLALVGLGLWRSVIKDKASAALNEVEATL